jgi:putative sigma-54 modulation protein
MPVEVTIRHMQLPDATQTYARAKADELMEVFPRIEHVHVIIDHEKRDCVASLVIQARNHIRIDAEGTSETPRQAIDEAVEKAGKQLRKLRDKVQEKRVRNNRLKADVEPSGEEIEGGTL